MKCKDSIDKKDKLSEKRKSLEAIATKSKYSFATGQKGFFHYTSISTLFSILEGDAFWISNTRFSNDSSEERVFPFECMGDFAPDDDHYIFCLSEQGDCLSQWRGYCYNGGVAIKLNLSGIRQYSVLNANYDSSRKYELVYNAPIPVIYVPVPKKNYEKREDGQDKDSLNQLMELWKRLESLNIPMSSLIPQFKNSKFEEERELRLLFENYNNELAQCIRFRSLKNNVKVPYMVVKMGDTAKEYTKCEFDISRYEKPDYKYIIEDYIKSGKSTVVIPQGSDQESIYYRMEKMVNKYNQSKEKAIDLRIECEGHLPVEEIIVAPTYDRERKAEQIKRYCHSKYWLRQTKITCSEIPYIPPSELE